MPCCNLESFFIELTAAGAAPVRRVVYGLHILVISLEHLGSTEPKPLCAFQIIQITPVKIFVVKSALVKLQFQPHVVLGGEFRCILNLHRLRSIKVVVWLQDGRIKSHCLPAVKPQSPVVGNPQKGKSALSGFSACIVNLRYTQIFSTVKRLLESGEIGRLIHMDLIENVAYWHFAHSYVRGNWRREEDSSPMILAKSCHDLDLLRWFAGSACISLSSNGGLSVFRAESAPEGADDRCTRCALSTRCPYSAVRIYMENEKTGILGGNAGWPCSVLSETPTPDSIRAALEKGPYGRCVYACDNDVADHQCVNMQFANGVCATFTVTAFTQECCRTMRAMGSLGELEIDMLRNRVMLRRFGQPEQIIELDKLTDRFAGHGGGDDRMMDALAALFQREDPASLTSVDVSIDSHIMALAAERSRLEGGACIDLLQFARRT